MAAEPSAPKLALVVAVAQNGVIGRDNALPWHLPSDLKYFRAVTMNKPIIMGRKTYESIGRPLPGRDNIVISRSGAELSGDIITVPSLKAAIAEGVHAATARNVDEIMVIGGAQIYALTLPAADRLYVTEVKLEPEGDTWFPAIDKTIWQEVKRDPRPADGDQPAHDFVVYERVK